MKIAYLYSSLSSHSSRFDVLFSSVASEYFSFLVSFSPSRCPSILVDQKCYSSWETIIHYLETNDFYVISGPMDDISIHLAHGKFKHIAISFATDIMVSAAKSERVLYKFISASRSFDGVIIDNLACENALISLGFPSNSLLRIPWGPTSLISRQCSRSDFGIDLNCTLLLYPRALDPHYDPLTFIHVLERLVPLFPSLVVIFIATGSCLDECKSLVQKYNLNRYVRWFDPMPYHDFCGLTSISDLVVVSPITDGTSVTVMDAMKLNVPVVSSLTAGSAEWIIDGITGWTFPVGNSEAMLKAISTCLNSSSQRRASICRNARQLVNTRAGWSQSSKLIISFLTSIFS